MNEMNVFDAKKSVSLVLLCGFGAVALAGCAFNPSKDPSSPLAPRVEALVAANSAYPRLQDFPAAPTGLPTAAEVASRVAGLSAAERRLDAEVAAVDWQLDGDAEAVAQSIRQRVADMGVTAPSVNSEAEIEAFAASLRTRAKAPPPIDRPIR